MNLKGNIKYIVTGSIFFLCIYMFLAAIPIGPDIYFTPVWTTDIGTDVQIDPLLPLETENEAFILGNRFGYFTPDGKILASKQITERVSASPAHWAQYGQDAKDTIVYLPNGSPKTTIPGSGFLHLDDNRTYLFLPGGDAVSQFDDNGGLLWKREHTAPISAFNSSPAGALVGYADGMLACVTPDGLENFSFYPGGSDYQVILGCALSEDGTHAAVVSGIEKQRFLLIRITGKQYKIVYHAFLEGNLRRQVYVDFEKNGKFAFFESENNLGIVDCQKLTARNIIQQGHIIAAGECPGDNLFMVLAKNGQKYTLSAVERPNHLVASTSFSASEAFLIQRNEAIYLGTDSKISRIDIRGIQ